VVFLLPDFGYPVYATTGHKQDSQNLGARKPQGINRIAKLWEQENHRA
jgi:hypothetical protein